MRHSGAAVRGPVPLPTTITRFDLLRSPHVDKDSREQIEIRTYHRLLEIPNPSEKTTQALADLQTPDGVSFKHGAALMKTLLGVKLGMSRLFRDDGVAVPVTVLDLSGNRVCQLKKADGPDGYDAVQLAHGERSKKRLSQAAIGHRAKHKAGLARRLREVRCAAAELEGLEPGQELGLDAFDEGLLVDVIGVSKGKGFAGGIRRHNFRSGRATHGTSRAHNTIGSSGQCQDPGRVFKGKKMPGHLGARGCTVRNLPVARVDRERGAAVRQGRRSRREQLRDRRARRAHPKEQGGLSDGTRAGRPRAQARRHRRGRRRAVRPALERAAGAPHLDRPGGQRPRGHPQAEDARRGQAHDQAHLPPEGHGPRPAPACRRARSGAAAAGPSRRTRATISARSSTARSIAPAWRPCCRSSPAEERLFVAEELAAAEIKTKPCARMVADFGGAPKRLLFVDTDFERNFAFSARNIKRVSLQPLARLLSTDLLRHGRVVLSRRAFDAIGKAWA